MTNFQPKLFLAFGDIEEKRDQSLFNNNVLQTHLKWPPEVQKWSLVKSFVVPITKSHLKLLKVHKSEDRGGIKMPR